MKATSKKKVVKKEVAGPYRSQSSVPSLESAATQHEHRQIPVAPTGRRETTSGSRSDVFADEPLHLPTKSERRRSRAQRAAIRRLFARPGATSKSPTVQTLSAIKPGSHGGTKVDPLELAVQRDVIEPAQKAKVVPKSKTLGQKVYQRVAEWGPTAITAGPELKAGSEALSVVVRGAQAGDVGVGGVKALGSVVKPIAVDTAEGRAALATRAEEKAAATTGSGLKGTASKALKVVRRVGPKADAAAVRRATGTATRREAAAAAGVPLKVTKAVAGQSLPVVRGHEEALVQEPGKTLATTLRIAPGVLTTPVGMAADVGLSVGRLASTALHAAHVPGAKSYSESDIAAPLKGQLKSQEEFAKEVASVVTSSDPEYVKKQVENHLGLLLPAMAAPVVARAFKPTYARALESLRSKSELGRVAAGLERRPMTEEPQHVSAALEDRQHRIEESKRAATTKHHAEIETHSRSADVLRYARKAKGPTDVLRELASRKRGRKTHKVKVNPGDAVGFLARHGINRNVEDGLAQVQHIHDRLDHEAAAELPKGRVNTLDMTTYLLKHPEVLGDANLWKAVDAYKAQAKSLTTSEAARVQPVMQAHANPELGQRDPGIRHFDRVPIETRHLTSATTRSELVKEIAADRAKLKRAATKGDTAKVRELAAGIAAKHQGLYRDLTPEERQATVDDLAEMGIEDPRLVREHLKAARAEKAVNSDKGLESEYLDQAQNLIAHYRHEDPAFVSQADVRSKGSAAVSAVGGQIPKIPAKVHQRTGRLQEIGAVEESLPSLLRESIRVPVARKHIFANMRDFLEQRAARFDGKTEITSREAGKLIDDGRFDPARNILIPRQLYKRAFDALDQGDETQIGALREAMGKPAQQQIVSTLGREKGRKYIVVPREAATEFFAQTEKLGGAQHVVAQANRITSRLILGTSPAWAAMQLLAEGTQAAAAVSPYRLYRGLKAFRELPDEKKIAFQAWAGETPGVAIAPKNVELGLRDGQMQEASDAFGVANKTAVGRGLKNLSTAELLGLLDRKKGGIYRRAVAAGKIDRDLNSKLSHFAGGMRQLWRHEDAITTQLKGKPLSEQMAWFTEHPKEMQRIQGYLDDTMGNWNALTRHERTAASVVMFYPFLRMSLRWLLHSFPKQHPIKASILYYLGQQNANELHKLLHGDPSFFNWAMVPIHAGEGGKETSLVDLSRMAPGANTLTQGLGAGSSGTLGSIGEQAVQPALAATVTAITGVSPLSGRQEPNSGWQALAELAELPLPARLAGVTSKLPGQGPSTSPTAEAFRKEGSAGLTAKLRSAALPVIPKSVGQEKTKVELEKLLSEKYKNPVPSVFNAKVVKAIFGGPGGDIDEALVKQLAGEREAASAAGKKATALESGILGEQLGSLSDKQSKALETITGGVFISSSGDKATNQFGLPSTSTSALRKQFGLPDTSTSKLKEEFGIE